METPEAPVFQRRKRSLIATVMALHAAVKMAKTIKKKIAERKAKAADENAVGNPQSEDNVPAAN